VNAAKSQRSGWRSRSAIAAVLLCAILDGALLAKYMSDDAVLERVIELDDTLTPSGKVVSIIDYIETNVPKRETTDESFIPGLAFLRPTARQVLEKGGDCADRSRLLIELLKREGVSASKVALYDRQGVPQHAVVEAVIEDEDRAMAVDALFGMYFPNPAGGFHSIADINRDESILVARIEALGPSEADIRSYPVDRYTYASPRSINWDKSPMMRGLYRGLRAVMGDAVDDLERPAIVEDPVLMTLVGALAAQAAAGAGMLIIGRIKRRRF
jgi:hypothetical protein